MTQPLNSRTAVANYSITHERATVVVSNSTVSFDYGGLVEGDTAVFGIVASNCFGVSREVLVNITLPIPSINDTSKCLLLSNYLK